MIAVIAIVVALGTACVFGCATNRRSGVLRVSTVPSLPAHDHSDLGLSRTGPTVLHFGAVWCGPCDAVRRVVDQVCAALPDVAHVELDIDTNPAAARRLSVLSLPTTFIFDAAGGQKFRSAGVPKAADLHAALQPLLTPERI